MGFLLVSYIFSPFLTFFPKNVQNINRFGCIILVFELGKYYVYPGHVKVDLSRLFYWSFLLNENFIICIENI